LSTLRGKTLFVSGASRGIGKAIALRAARDGANIVLAAKTNEPHPKLPGTIHSAADEIVRAGGRALPLQVDIRDEKQVERAVAEAVQTFGGIDILVNNASAISLTGTRETTLKRYDLMQSVNTRGTFVCSQACLPALLQASAPHILTISPPLNLDPKWFGPHVAYTISKYGMSLCVLGMAAEFPSIRVNALWPRTAIATAAVQNLPGGDALVRGSRTVEIMADAAHVVLTGPAHLGARTTGQFLTDEEVLRAAGVSDFAKYAVDPEAELLPDFFL
jgi:citronellol/citronellal dehydrogenase